jgi:hypothetical protein
LSAPFDTACRAQRASTRFKSAVEFAKLITMNARKAVIPMLKRALISALIILPIASVHRLGLVTTRAILSR